MKFTYLGHSSFLLEIKDTKILFDPFISGNELAKDLVDINTIEADYIFISHGHADHVADAPAIAIRTGSKVIAAYEVCGWLEKQGVKNCHPVNHGGKLTFDFGTVKFTSAIHSSSMPDGTYGGNPMGFYIETSEKNVYYSGDTALTYDMKLLADYGRVDVALLPVGDNFTMGYEEACIAAQFVNTNHVIALHYDTFGFIVIDKNLAKAYFEQHGKTLSFVEIGNSIPL